MASMFIKIGLIAFSATIFHQAPAEAQSAVRFSGGVCASQGDWVQQAFEQSSILVSAIEKLKDDPNCTALVKTLENSASLREFTQSTNESTGGIAGFYRQLQAVREYVNPEVNVEGMDPQKFKSIVTYLVFRKSLDAVTAISRRSQYESLTKSQKQVVDGTSEQVREFLRSASKASQVAVETTKSMLAAMPQSRLCFAERPSEALVVFTSLINSASALATGGQVTALGDLVSSVIKFDREMKFMNNLSTIEYERYRASVSCLVESTQESYCALQDAQDALDFVRGDNRETLARFDSEFDPTMNPMRGLITLLRDAPIISSWLQKVLFGVDPKIQVEAEMKNTNWDSIIAFIKDMNTLPAVYRDRKQVYYFSTQGQDISIKTAQLKELIDHLTTTMTGNIEFGNVKTINFFARAMDPKRIPFFLLGIDLPVDFNAQTNTFDTLYLKYVSSGQYGLNNPDALVDAVEDRMFELINRAGSLANSYFGERMIVDQQNLIVEGMNGPAVSPYQALINLQKYNTGLIEKLNRGRRQPKISSDPMRIRSYDAMIAMLRDSNERLQIMVNAMSQLGDLPFSGGKDGIDKVLQLSRESMNAIYETANMLVARDSLLTNRLVNAVRMDISDTLWRGEHLNPRQTELLQVLGKDVLTRLSQYFSEDPVVRRLDVAQAMPIHEANLEAVTNLFSETLRKQIVDINCKLFGYSWCSRVVRGPEHSGGWISGISQQAWDTLKFKSVGDIISSFAQGPVSDAKALYNLRAKLCMQSLGFGKRAKEFYSACKGATLVSDFSDERDRRGLNASYDQTIQEMLRITTEKKPGYLTHARTRGVCALRSYLRKNHIYRMYLDMDNGQERNQER